MNSSSKPIIDTLFIIPIFNRWDPIELLLEDLSKQSFQSYQVLIVNHGDQSTPDHMTNHQRVTIIKASSDLWFTGAMNTGIRAALQNFQSEYLVLLNDDVRIPDSLWLEKMRRNCQETSLCSSMAVDAEKRVLYQNLKFSWLRLRFLKIGSGAALSAQNNETLQYADCLPTRGLIFRPTAIDRIGYLDEVHLPHYGSDYEWTIRAKKRGFVLLMANNTHLVTETNPQSSRTSGRNRYATQKIKNFLRDLNNPHKNGSFPTTTQFARLVFPFPINILFVTYHLSRKILGFVFSNYILKPRPDQV